MIETNDKYLLQKVRHSILGQSARNAHRETICYRTRRGFRASVNGFYAGFHGGMLCVVGGINFLKISSASFSVSAIGLALLVVGIVLLNMIFSNFYRNKPMPGIMPTKSEFIIDLILGCSLLIFPLLAWFPILIVLSIRSIYRSYRNFKSVQNFWFFVYAKSYIREIKAIQKGEFEDVPVLS